MLHVFSVKPLSPSLMIVVSAIIVLRCMTWEEEAALLALQSSPTVFNATKMHPQLLVLLAQQVSSSTQRL